MTLSPATRIVGILAWVFMIAGLIIMGLAAWGVAPRERPISPAEKRTKQLEARVEAIEATITKGHDRALEVGVIDDKRPSEHFSEEDK